MAKVSGPGLLFLFSVILCVDLSAQLPTDIFQQVETSKPGQGTVKISQDNAIRNLVDVHVLQQRKLNGIRGYCIWIFTGTRPDAEQYRANFIRKHEDVICVPKWEYPNFKLYVGNFRTKSEALSFLKKIENEYPDAFIREDIIPFPD